MDDFTAWLAKGGGAYEHYIRAMASIDFYFYSLAELRQTLVRVLSEARRPG